MVEPVKSVHSIKPYIPGKPIEEVERELGIKEVVKLASNENPYGPSPMAIKAVETELKKVNRYPDGSCYYLKEKLAQHLNVDTNELIIGNGSNEILEIIARTFLYPEDEAIYGEYAFIVYPLVVKAIGAKGVISPMEDLTHNLKDFLSRITDKTKMIFLANPNNPTGTIFKKNDLEFFLQEVPKDIVIVIDEAYFEYVENHDYPNSLIYHNEFENLITVRTFSKIYGLAGLRIGYAIASKNVTSFLERMREPFNVNSLAQVAAYSALDDIDHVNMSKIENLNGRKFLYDKLDSMGIKYIPTDANFILIKIENSSHIYNDLLKQGVIVRPVANYGLSKYLRVTIGTMEENRILTDKLFLIRNLEDSQKTL